jgi:hypothetical protein
VEGANDASAELEDQAPAARELNISGSSVIVDGRWNGCGGLHGDGIRLQIGVDILRHDELPPHQRKVSRDGADVLVLSLVLQAGDLDGILQARFDELGGVQDEVGLLE